MNNNIITFSFSDNTRNNKHNNSYNNTFLSNYWSNNDISRICFYIRNNFQNSRSSLVAATSTRSGDKTCDKQTIYMDKTWKVVSSFQKRPEVTNMEKIILLCTMTMTSPEQIEEKSESLAFSFCTRFLAKMPDYLIFFTYDRFLLLEAYTTRKVLNRLVFSLPES